MVKKASCARALRIASSVALCTYAVAAQADPVSLQGVCHLDSLTDDSPSCSLTYLLADSFQSPGSARRSKVLVDGVIVGVYLNDRTNPVDFAIPTVTGSVEVACGVAHAVTAFVAPLGAGSTPYKKVGDLPSILCPSVP